MKLYSIAEISRELNIPASTLRYYRDKYCDYLPSIGEGKKKRYKAEAIAILKRIAMLTQNGKTANDIAILLERENTKTIDIETTIATTTTTKSQLDIFDILAKQQAQINELKQQQLQMQKQFDNHYKLVDERLRLLVQPKEETKRSWWQKFFGQDSVK